MANRNEWVAACALVVLSVTGCKPKLEGSVKGYKPGSSDVLIVHVKSSEGVRVSCSTSCYECNFVYVPSGGEVDIEVELTGTNATKPQKQVCLRGQKGLFTAKLDLPLEQGGVPPKLELRGSGMYSTALPKAFGMIRLLPAPNASLNAEAKTTVEIGGSKLTADEHGYASGPVTLSLNPTLESLPLTSACSATPTALGSVPVALTFPSGTKTSGTLALTTEVVAESLSDFFTKIEPKLFPWEKPGATAPKKSRRAVLYPGSTKCEARGPTGAKLSDVQIVVLTSSAPERTGTCEYSLTEKESGESRGRASGKLVFHDYKATAYDRFTGKQVASKVIQAPQKCNSDIYDVGSTIPSQDSYVEEGAIISWASTL